MLGAGRRLLLLAVVLFLVSTCGGGSTASSTGRLSSSTAPSPTPILSRTSAPSPNPALTPAPTGASIDALLLAPPATLVAAQAAQGALPSGVTLAGCASGPSASGGSIADLVERGVLHGPVLPAADQAADHWAACLQDVALAWIAYGAAFDPGRLVAAQAYYGYAISVVGASGRVYLEAALRSFEPRVVVSTDPPDLALDSVETAAPVSLTMGDLHDLLRDAYAADLTRIVGVIVGGCADACVAVGAGICGQGCLVTMAASDTLVDATPVTACYYEPSSCPAAAAQAWRMYAATNDPRFARIVLGLRDFALDLGERDRQDFFAAFAAAVKG